MLCFIDFHLAKQLMAPKQLRNHISYISIWLATDALQPYEKGSWRVARQRLDLSQV